MTTSEALMVAEGYAKRMRGPGGFTVRESEAVAVVLAKAVVQRDKYLKEILRQADGSIVDNWAVILAKKALSEGREAA